MHEIEESKSFPISLLIENVDNNGIDNSFFRLIVENFPVGIMIIDSDRRPVLVNQVVRDIFLPAEKKVLPKCFKHMGRFKVCEDCILKENGNSDIKARRKSYRIGQKYIMEQAVPLKDKYMLIFRDVSREIGLLKEIRDDQDRLIEANAKIKEQNDILKRLSLINIKISQMKDLEDILKEIINSINETFSSEKGAILLTNKHRKIENAYFTDNIDVQEKEKLIAYTGTLEDAPNDYAILEIGDISNNMGKIFLYKPENKVEQSILQLFTMQINTLVSNVRLHRKLEEIAHTDSLTGAFNRYYFEKRYKEEKELASRFKQPLSLLMIDVNGLKRVNDELGHEAGDLLIQNVAKRIKKNSNHDNEFFRFGGDEFIVLLSNHNQDEMTQLVSKLKRAQDDAFFEFKTRELPVRYSVGGACSAAAGLDRLKEVADNKMYEDKEEYYRVYKKYR